MEKWLARMEWKMGRWYVPNLMKYLCIAMLGVFVLDLLPLRSASGLLTFNRDLIFKGQVWRLITFVFLPPTGSLAFILLGLYFYFFLGSTLEQRWGSRRFCLYYLIGVLSNILAGMIMGTTTNMFLNLSLFLSFAVLYPDEEFLLFFILPIKAKWLGIADAVLLLYTFIQTGWAFRVAMLFSLLPFFLFVGKDLFVECKMAWHRLRYRINRNG